MSDLPWLPLAGGALAGLAVALLIVLFVQLRRRATGRDVVAAARAEAATLARTSKADADQLLRSAQADSDRLTADARRAADSARTDAILAGKMETLALREELDKETQSRREEWARQDRRAEERERAYDRRQEQLTALEGAIQARDASITAREQALAAREKEIDALKAEQARRLEQIAGLTAEEARRELLQRAEEAARSDAAALARDIKEQAKKGAEREAQRIVSIAIQRIAPEQTAATTVAAVTLPSDEMKGRIIGREGRNIRAFELATGVDVIIDDTPDTVVISCFDPIRREVGRRALEALIADGRIQPGPHRGRRRQGPRGARHPARGAGRAGRLRHRHQRTPSRAHQAGRPDAVPDQLRPEHPRALQGSGLAGGDHGRRARRRREAGQAGRLAARHRQGAHPRQRRHPRRARRRGRAPLRRERRRRSTASTRITTTCRTSPPSRCWCRRPTRISGSRPGARREAFESYVKRLTKLEEIANAFRGVEKTTVIQAGREIRVIVTPDQVDDAQAAELSEQIARKIENELQYPGQIRVVVIRETRSVEVAR